MLTKNEVFLRNILESNSLTRYPAYATLPTLCNGPVHEAPEYLPEGGKSLMTNQNAMLVIDDQKSVLLNEELLERAECFLSPDVRFHCTWETPG